jgi:hypothetical protein
LLDGGIGLPRVQATEEVTFHLLQRFTLVMLEVSNARQNRKVRPHRSGRMTTAKGLNSRPAKNRNARYARDHRRQRRRPDQFNTIELGGSRGMMRFSKKGCQIGLSE